MAGMFVASLAFFSCNTEEVDPDLPLLEVDQTVIAIPKDGGDNIALQITSNRPWTLTIPSETDWLMADKKSGDGNATVTFSAGPNAGADREVTVRVATSTIYKDVRVTQSGNIVTESLYADDFGTTAVQTGTQWPLISDYTGWNKTGTGSAAVTYTSEGGAVSVRTNAPSSGYTGASGSVNVMMASAGASFLVNDINPMNMTHMAFSFGSNETNTTLKLYYSTDGTTWTEVPYTKTSTTWDLVQVEFDIPAGSTKLSLKFTAAATQYGTRVDDLKLVGSGGTPVTTPVVQTAAATNIAATSATVGGSYTYSQSSPAITEVGVEYKKDDGVSAFVKQAASGTATPFTVNLTGLTDGQKYLYHAYVKTADNQTYYGSELNFTAQAVVSAIWNENVGNTEVPGNTDVSAFTAWGKTGSGISTLAYESSGTISVRKTAPQSTDCYAGASGGNSLFFGTLASGNPTFIAKNISISGLETVTLTFGSSKSMFISGTGNVQDPTFSTSELKLYYSTDGGTTWIATTYTRATPSSDQTKCFVLSTAVLPVSGKISISFKWESSVASVYKIDDMKLVAGGTVVTPTDPTVVTGSATNIAKTTVTLGGTYVAGTDAVTEVGFQYKKNDGVSAFVKVTATGTGSPFTANLTGLAEGTEYVYYAYAKTSAKTVDGNEESFITASDPVVKTIADIRALKTEVPSNGNTYLITNNWTITGHVVSDKAGGNLNAQNFALVDGTTANSGIIIRLSAAHSFNVGEEVTVNLQGATLSNYNGLLQMAPSEDSKAAKTATAANVPSPVTITVTQLTSGDYESMYVAIENTQVTNAFVSIPTIGDAGSNKSTTMEVNSNPTTYTMYVMRTSAFVASPMPTGSGTLKGIAGVFQTDYQIQPRNAADFAGLTGARFGTPLTLTFGTPTLSGTLKVGEVSAAKILVPYTTAAGTENYTINVAVSGAGAAGINDVTGLTKTLTAGSGNIEIPISGTPTTAGAVTFTISGIAGLSITTVNDEVEAAGSGGETNLVLNGDFSSWTSGIPNNWEFDFPERLTITQGTSSFVVTNPTGTTKLFQQIPVTAGKQYKLSFKYKASHAKFRIWSGFAPNPPSIAGIVFLTTNVADDPMRSNNGYLAVATNATPWEYTFTVPAGQTTLQLEFRYYSQTESSFELSEVTLVEL